MSHILKTIYTCQKYDGMKRRFFSFQTSSGRCRPYACWPSPMFRSGFGIFLVVIEFIAPLVILIYCYGSIIYILTRRVDSSFNTAVPQTDTFQMARKNTIKTFALISVCFVVCWSCNQILFLMYNFGFEVNWNGFINKFGVIMAFTNCTINPFVYLIKYRDYQKALMGLFGCKKSQDDSSITYSKTMATSVATITSYT